MIRQPTQVDVQEVRRHLLTQVERLAGELLLGQDPPPPIQDLRDLAAACDAVHLHVEAARVRRWLGESP